MVVLFLQSCALNFSMPGEVYAGTCSPKLTICLCWCRSACFSVTGEGRRCGVSLRRELLRGSSLVDEAQACVSITSRHDLLSVFQWAFRQLRYMCSTFNSRVLVTAEGVGAGLHCAACFSERDLSQMGLRQAGLLPAGVAKVFQWIFDDCRVFRRA